VFHAQERGVCVSGGGSGDFMDWNDRHENGLYIASSLMRVHRGVSTPM
jgi:hypothetical protein